jgi:hypothetical protein
MSKVRSPICYVYDSDEEKTLEENLRSMASHMMLVAGGETSFRLTLEFNLPVEAVMDADGMAKVIAQAVRDVEELANGVYVPVAIDQNGKPLYQRKDDSDRSA